ncbi:molybdopterin-synthase adenylyltransferase MoeB [Accumulibacter sp.]|uniref:HesA/MoeB/ThiF family protein n=1 Tax=Accumulibacter sp. TaxID=2053492 RepID=UPI0025E418F6|nr:molybdopterin-synthase adenylyltransferase MoeB [Accumulibacter sp.]MCM8625330.1 molybdopterin-synthase adenylyltransferase MoeB [Accumulibacter sp.]
MNDGQLLRYSRHILLEEIGIVGQQRLVDGRALVIGAGGLGSPAALYLASAGVGRLTVADGDTVDLTNLQRQILHTDQRVGQPKAQSARIALNGVNPEVRVREVASRVAGDELAELVADADVVLDCSDNFATRHAVNRACVERRKPLVSGAAIGFAGQLAVFDSRRADAPCYHCLFPEGEDVEEIRCAVMGVFAPLTGIIGSMQAAEAIKLLVGCGEVSEGRLWLLDGLAMEWRSVRFARDPRCPVCVTGPAD